MKFIVTTHDCLSIIGDDGKVKVFKSESEVVEFLKKKNISDAEIGTHRFIKISEE